MEWVADAKVESEGTVTVTETMNDDVDLVARGQDNTGIGAGVSIEPEAARVE